MPGLLPYQSQLQLALIHLLRIPNVAVILIGTVQYVNLSVQLKKDVFMYTICNLT